MVRTAHKSGPFLSSHTCLMLPIMVTSNRGLIVALCSQAAISAAASSAALASLAPEKVVAGVTLLNAMLSAGTAVYVALTGQKVPQVPSDQTSR